MTVVAVVGMAGAGKSEAAKVFEERGVKIIVDPKSMVYLDGTELDYKREGLNEGFEFNNPNAKDSCGCGESFTVWLNCISDHVVRS